MEHTDSSTAHCIQSIVFSSLVRVIVKDEKEHLQQPLQQLAVAPSTRRRRGKWMNYNSFQKQHTSFLYFFLNSLTLQASYLCVDRVKSKRGIHLPVPPANSAAPQTLPSGWSEGWSLKTQVFRIKHWNEHPDRHTHTPTPTHRHTHTHTHTPTHTQTHTHPFTHMHCYRPTQSTDKHKSMLLRK
jgi:hypothetical protein